MRVFIVVPGLFAGIEIDNMSPGRKSIQKMACNSFDVRIIALRNGRRTWDPCPRGIDRIVHSHSRQARDASQ